MRNPLPEIDLHLRVRKYDQKFFQEQVKMQTISVSKCKIALANKLLTLLKLLSLPLLLGLDCSKSGIYSYIYVCMLLWLKRFKMGFGSVLELEQDGRGWDGSYLVHN